jgi:hypothetical protein
MQGGAMEGLGLPSELTSRPFTVAQGREAGLRLRTLRSTRLHVPTHGVRMISTPATVHERAAAFALGLPDDAAFSHVSAAQLLGLPLPTALEAPEVLDVMRPTSRAQVRRDGCRGHRGLERREVIDVQGLRVVAPADTRCDMGELTSPALAIDDLVVMGDAVVNRLEPEGIATLRSALDSRTRPRGRARLMAAGGLIRVGSRSPMETRTRLMFHRAGFPEPELNAEVLDCHGGWLLDGDFVWRRQRVIGEYQGADHASRKRRSADSMRSGLATDEDYQVIEIYAEDVYGRARRCTLLRRFARAMDIDPATLTIE